MKLDALSLAVFVLYLVGSIDAHIKETAQPVVKELWRRVARASDIITSPNLDSFLSRYDPSNKNRLDLDECRFKTGLQSWVRDFMKLGVTTGYAAAYYWTLDVDGHGLYGRLTIEDIDELVEICEKHSKRCYSNSRCRGLLTEEDFKRGFKEVIFRYLPFTLMFSRFTRYEYDHSFDCQLPDAPIGLPYSPAQPRQQRRSDVVMMSQRLKRDVGFEDFQYEQMNKKDFGLIFYNIDQNGDGILESREVTHFWTIGLYGTRDDARSFFTAISHGKDTISRDNWKRLFDELDCRNQNGELDVMEFLQLDLMVHNIKEREDGKCILKRK